MWKDKSFYVSQLPVSDCRLESLGVKWGKKKNSHQLIRWSLLSDNNFGSSGNCRQKTKEKVVVVCYCYRRMSRGKNESGSGTPRPCLNPLGSLMDQRNFLLYRRQFAVYERNRLFDGFLNSSIKSVDGFIFNISSFSGEREREDSIFSPRLFDKVGRSCKEVVVGGV